MRNDIATQWLAQSGYGNWAREPIAGDASARRYERLRSPKGAQAIFMDAPPDVCGSQKKFIKVARHLRSIGLSAPDVFAFDEVLGMMILEDLGEQDFATHLRAEPQDDGMLYEAAVDVLLILGSAQAPSYLPIMTPDVGANMVDLAFEWAAHDRSSDLQREITDMLTTLLIQVSAIPTTLSLRDFHAENLIWRPDLSGIARAGLLDFQDAFVTHPTYDLASLLRDARRDVNPELTPILLDRMGGGEETIAAFHIMAVQRNLRILGIFNRLAQHAGKSKYLEFVPRVCAYLRMDLAAPQMQGIAPLIERAFDLKGSKT